MPEICFMASSPSSSCKYDVFLSFRGEDTRCNFTSHLYAAFCQKKIKTFIDDEEISRGEKISPAIAKAIQGSKVSIIIFSKDYASSDWCLNELVKILESKKINGQIVIPVFYHVDPSDVRKQNGSFGNAFVEHEKQLKNMPGKIQKWRAALTEASDLSGWDSMTIRSEAQLVNKIVDDVLKKLKSSAKKNQHPFNQFSAFIQVILSYRFLIYSSVLQSVQCCKSRNWDQKSKHASFNKKEHDYESLSRDEVEMVMRKLTLFCSSEDEELPQKLGSAELSWLFEEKEPSLEEVKGAFDVFDENNDGFIDATELQRVLCILGLGEGFDVENCKKMIKIFDENGDGRIDFKEFVKFMETSFVES